MDNEDYAGGCATTDQPFNYAAELPAINEALKLVAIEARNDSINAPIPPPFPGSTVEEEIERIAKLPLHGYDLVREDHARTLNMRVSTLDKMVAKKRRALGLDTNDEKGQGRAVKIADIELWESPVDGSKLVDALSTAVKKHVVLRDEQATAIAYWILHTWLVNEFHISPRLAITSPTKGCGKTTVLRLLNILARRPKRAGSVSPPALFRTIEAVQPTFLLDETEKYVEHGGDFHALLNEGHAKGSSVLRVLGDAMELREFAVFSAAAFARNGAMPDDLEQRSIVIELQRRKSDEPLEELREDRCEPLRQIARMCARWAKDNADDVRGRDPDMGGHINRGADNWRPLFAIAETIGGDCPAGIRVVAEKLGPREASSYGVMLLADIKTIFADKNTDRLSSASIVEALHEIEGRPWIEWGRSNNKKPISKNQLAGVLKEFKVAPETVRIGEGTARGYLLHRFDDAFERYIDAPKGDSGASEPAQRNKPTAAGTFATFQGGTEKTAFHPGAAQKPLQHSNCYVVPPCEAKNAPVTQGKRAERLLDSTVYDIHRNPEHRRPPAICSGPSDDLNDFDP